MQTKLEMVNCSEGQTPLSTWCRTTYNYSSKQVCSWMFFFKTCFCNHTAKHEHCKRMSTLVCYGQHWSYHAMDNMSAPTITVLRPFFFWQIDSKLLKFIPLHLTHLDTKQILEPKLGPMEKDNSNTCSFFFTVYSSAPTRRLVHDLYP